MAAAEQPNVIASGIPEAVCSQHALLRPTGGMSGRFDYEIEGPLIPVGRHPKAARLYLGDAVTEIRVPLPACWSPRRLPSL